MKRWFFSYAQVYRDGRFMFGHTIGHTIGNSIDGHPINTVERWNRSYGEQDGFKIVLLSFCEVGPEVPDTDVLSPGIS